MCQQYGRAHHLPLSKFPPHGRLRADTDKPELITILKQPVVASLSGGILHSDDTNEVPNPPFSPVLGADPSLVVLVRVGNDVKQRFEENGADLRIKVRRVHKDGELFGPGPAARAPEVRAEKREAEHGVARDGHQIRIPVRLVLTQGGNRLFERGGSAGELENSVGDVGCGDG